MLPCYGSLISLTHTKPSVHRTGVHENEITTCVSDSKYKLTEGIRYSRRVYAKLTREVSGTDVTEETLTNIDNLLLTTLYHSAIN